MDFSTVALFFKTFLLPIIFTLCATVWTCGNKKPSTEKTSTKPKKKKEAKIIFKKECFGAPVPPTALKPSKIGRSKARAALPAAAVQKKTSSEERDAKNQQPQQQEEYPQPQSLVLPSSGESERVKAALKTKTPAAEKKSLPTESTDLNTFEWMNNNNNDGEPQKVDAS